MGARDLGEKLNARYLLRGSVRRAENQVRITAELIEAGSGDTLWADRFDDEAVRLFDLQDRLTHRIVTALAGRLNVRDRQELGRPRTKSMQAYDHFLFGRRRFFLYAGAEEHLRLGGQKGNGLFPVLLEQEPEIENHPSHPGIDSIGYRLLSFP